MKKLVIFDLDGTLLNTIADLAAATNQALQYYGYPTHETEAYRFFVGNGINKLFERFLLGDRCFHDARYGCRHRSRCYQVPANG